MGKKDTNRIPKGMYCYERLDKQPDGSYKVVNQCPYWSINPDLPYRENGVCAYLGKSDYEINEERGDMEWIDNKGKVVRITEAHEVPNSLIWDEVKECDINMEEEEEC